MTPTREHLLTAMRAVIESRPGFEWQNYAGAPQAYREDYSVAHRHLRDGRELLRAVEHSGMPAEILLDNLRHRLTWNAERGGLEYCTGQYYPTEYRGAACRALADSLWDYYRDSGSTGDSLRRTMRSVLGARLARRWFN